MYSLVMMSAMTAAPDAAEFNGYFRDLFSRGGSCSGAARYSCSGGAAYPPAGCCGGGGLFSGERVRRIFDRGGSGCCGGTAARSYGCCGGGTSYSCSGSMAYSCFGGPVSYTPVMNGGLSCFGGPVPAAPAPLYDDPLTPGRPPAGIPYAVPDAAGPSGLQATAATQPVGVTVGGSAGARAKVVVRLPVDAKLSVDGTPLRLTGAERAFSTPPLPAGMEYTYQFTAEYERGGRVLTESRKVAVRAGSAAAVEFDDLTAAKLAPRDAVLTPTGSGDPVAGLVNPPAALPAADKTVGTLTAAGTGATARTTITVKLPPGATLYVDERRSPPGGSVRRLTTPPLPVGQEFSYRLRVELAQPVPGVGGTTVGMTETVTFRPGQERTADFTAR